MTAEADVRRAIRRVVDPCSDALGVPLDLEEMGLVTSCAVDERQGEVHVEMCLTAPCCTYGPAMAAALEAELLSLPWVRRAEVRIDHTEVWTPERLGAGARRTLDARRRRTRTLTDISPFDWSTMEAHRAP